MQVSLNLSNFRIAVNFIDLFNLKVRVRPVRVQPDSRRRLRRQATTKLPRTEWIAPATKTKTLMRLNVESVFFECGVTSALAFD